MQLFHLKSVFVAFLMLLSPLEAGRGRKPSERDLHSGGSGEKQRLSTLLSSLDPTSLAQHIAFAQLYPDTPQGARARAHAWKLLGADDVGSADIPAVDIEPLISFVTHASWQAPEPMAQAQVKLINALSSRLANRHLKGAHVWSQKSVLELPSEQIDLARALMLFEQGESDEAREAIKSYEASIDLMALQVRARLSENASPEEMIRAINQFIFHEMGFRFPPHSLYAKDIDLYTFLPSVLDGREGVCLGVSILYLAIAQRLDLPLEIVTPPGHIYVRYRKGDQLINIETTARGVHMPSDVYLGVNTRALQERTIKEVVGLAFMNRASVTWGQEKTEETITLYEKARLFLPEDRQLSMFLGLQYLFAGRRSEGRALLEPLRGWTPDEAISMETLPDDYLQGRVGVDGLKAVFMHVDDDRESIVKKQQMLQKILARNGKFRAGRLQLATTWLQLGRTREAYEELKKYHEIDPTSSTVEYYLTMLAMHRYDYNAAWNTLKGAESLCRARDFMPQALRGARLELRSRSADPN